MGTGVKIDATPTSRYGCFFIGCKKHLQRFGTNGPKRTGSPRIMLGTNNHFTASVKPHLNTRFNGQGGNTVITIRTRNPDVAGNKIRTAIKRPCGVHCNIAADRGVGGAGPGHDQNKENSRKKGFQKYGRQRFLEGQRNHDGLIYWMVFLLHGSHSPVVLVRWDLGLAASRWRARN